MLGTELAYVREQLKRCSPEEKAEAAKVAKASVKTIRRIAKLNRYSPSAQTVGRLAMHFKTREKRAVTA